jgi:mannose-6-phosphate isomerase-like protein (cupin superfamily)
MKISKESVTPFDFDGLSIVDYTADENLSASIAEISVSPGVKHKISWSKRSDKFYYIVTGRLQFTLNNEEFELNTGDICIVKKGQKFSYSNSSSEESKIILFHTPSFDLNAEVFEDLKSITKTLS